MRETLKSYCQRTSSESLLGQWDIQRNYPMTPDTVSYGSKQKAWWRCEKGHRWQAQIKSRAAGCGCPFCVNRQIQPEENSLAHKYPLLAAQWHPTKNGPLTPENLSPGTRRKVWWRCEHGHEWQAAVNSRTSGGCGCPVCAGRKVIPGENDFASRFPSLAAQWHPIKNGDLTPEQVAPGANRKVWWRCELGHDYQAAVAARTINGSGCPYCAGKKVLPGFNDLASRKPLLAKQWHPALNGGLTPEMVTCGSHRKVWWQCPEGHVWRSVVYSRAGPKQCGCPVCAGTGGRRQRTRLTAWLTTPLAGPTEN